MKISFKSYCCIYNTGYAFTHINIVINTGGKSNEHASKVHAIINILELAKVT